MTERIEKTDQEWRETLSDEEYQILRQGGIRLVLRHGDGPSGGV